MKGDIIQMMKDFHVNGKLVRGFNPSFIYLIPKNGSPQRIEEYRPISLVGGAYKIISKILADRLSKVIDSVVADYQSAFIKGRQIMDGILILNEAIDEAKKKLSRFFFKVDFSKTFDSINWGYLDAILGGFNFCDRWRKWIKACVESASASILVNGSPNGEFCLKRGLRQGDPLSPFLFILAMECLGLLTQKATELGLLKPALIGCQKIPVSHLQYADDVVFLCDGSKENLKTLKRILRLFELISGLGVNFSKSSLFGFNLSEEDVTDVARILDCKIERGHFI